MKKTGSESEGTLPERMAVAREATPVESAEDVKQADLDSEDLLQIYRDMLITRGSRSADTFSTARARSPAASTPAAETRAPAWALPPPCRRWTWAPRSSATWA